MIFLLTSFWNDVHVFTFRNEKRLTTAAMIDEEVTFVLLAGYPMGSIYNMCGVAATKTN